MTKCKYKDGEKYVGSRMTFFIHFVADARRIVLHWRARLEITIHEQTMSEQEVDDILQQYGATKV